MKNNSIKIFNEIRDIPFRIPMSATESLFDCAGKSILLRKKLEDLGIKARLAVCFFYWNDLNLPKDIKEIPHDRDCTHTFVEAFINEKWVKLDPSWDSALSKIFDIANFDGENSTDLAVRAIGFFDPEISALMIKKQTENYLEFVASDLARNEQFYEAVNNYLEAVRKSI